MMVSILKRRGGDVGMMKTKSSWYRRKTWYTERGRAWRDAATVKEWVAPLEAGRGKEGCSRSLGRSPMAP